MGRTHLYVSLSRIPQARQLILSATIFLAVFFFYYDKIRKKIAIVKGVTAENVKTIMGMKHVNMESYKSKTHGNGSSLIAGFNLLRMKQRWCPHVKYASKRALLDQASTSSSIFFSTVSHQLPLRGSQAEIEGGFFLC